MSGRQAGERAASGRALGTWRTKCAAAAKSIEPGERARATMRRARLVLGPRSPLPEKRVGLAALRLAWAGAVPELLALRVAGAGAGTLGNEFNLLEHERWPR